MALDPTKTLSSYNRITVVPSSDHPFNADFMPITDQYGDNYSERLSRRSYHAVGGRQPSKQHSKRRNRDRNSSRASSRMGLSYSSHSTSRDAETASHHSDPLDIAAFANPMNPDEQKNAIALIHSNATTFPYVPMSLRGLIAPADLDENLYFELINNKRCPIAENEVANPNCYLCMTAESDPNRISIYKIAQDIVHKDVFLLADAIVLFYEANVRKHRKARFTASDVINHFTEHDSIKTWNTKLEMLYSKGVHGQLKRGALASDSDGRNVHPVKDRLAHLEKSNRMYSHWLDKWHELIDKRK